MWLAAGDLLKTPKQSHCGLRTNWLRSAIPVLRRGSKTTNLQSRFNETIKLLLNCFVCVLPQLLDSKFAARFRKVFLRQVSRHLLWRGRCLPTVSPSYLSVAGRVGACRRRVWRSWSPQRRRVPPRLPFCHERYTARAAPQKVDADFILHVLDLSPQCRLRDPKAHSGFSEVQHFAHRQKVSQMSQFHR
jgi:hypothetical protein